MLSVSYAGKNAYSAGKTSGVLRGGASGANRCYVLAHCGGYGMVWYGIKAWTLGFFACLRGQAYLGHCPKFFRFLIMTPPHMIII